MTENEHWHRQRNLVDYSQPDQQYDSSLTRVAADSVHDAHGLLAVYPMASATPATHVARHLGNLTITATPPSFVQPDYYTLQGSSYPQGNPPPYTEYANEVNYLATRPTPSHDSGYWEGARTEAVRLLGEQAGPSYPYPSTSSWSPSPAQSSYVSSAFAQALFQRTAPTASYPTPPPPGITTSSSSLAFALGPPPSQPTPRTVYQSEQSAGFFDNFISQKSHEFSMSESGNDNIAINRPVTPPRRAEYVPQESPDPLALKPTATLASPAAVTPRKRKLVVQIDSPSVKRVHAKQPATSLQSVAPVTTRHSMSFATPLSSTASTTPSAVSTSMSKQTPKRTMTLAYVQVPPRPWMTPSSSKKDSSSGSLSSENRKGKMILDDTPDLCGYGSEEDEAYSPNRVRSVGNSVKSSARRTGDRDERAPLEKLSALFDDIFEAEDCLPTDINVGDLPSEFFSPFTIDCARPLLHSNLVRKLTKYVCQVARPTKRIRQGASAGIGTPRGKGRMAEIDTPILSRILKMLHRNVKAGEDLDPFFHAAIATASRDKTDSPRKTGAKKGGRGNKKSDARLGSPQDDDVEDNDMVPVDIQTSSKELPEMDYEKLARVLEIARDSVLAAECCIALLGSDRLTKQLYSEELITACLGTIKNQLTKVIYPFVEATAEPGSTISSPTLRHVVKNTSSASQALRRQLSETFQALSAVIPRVNNLVNAESVAMSDSIIIQAVYIAIGPFFVVESGGEGDTKVKKENAVIRTFGKSAMRGLRLDALSLIRSIFANHEDQRSWIIEEILTSLIKLSDTKQKAGQFRLRDGHSIRTVSALLLQLVQTSAHDVRIHARKIEKCRQQKFALKRQESFSESQQTPELFLDENDLEEIRLYTSGLESATKAAKTIILFLTQRSGKGKATKNSNEAEYRTIFDNLISDLLAVLYWPEWPAASLLLSIACKFMVSSLDDVKTSTQTESNAAKTIALDHLGVIAARIRSSALKMQQDAGETGYKFKSLKPLDEIVSIVDLKELGKLLAAHTDVASHLCKRSSEDQAYDSARELTAVTVGRELAAALRQVDIWISDPEEELNIKDNQKLLAFGQRIKKALRDVWKDPVADVFDIGSQEEVVRIDRLAEEIGTVQSLRSSFHPILNVILLALDAPAIFMRTKALRALGQMVTSDATILSAANVRRAIESHLLDSSPAVRDAAVELIGKYMIDSPEVAGDYYQKIADRIADTGLGVRKRVIRLLKAFYGVTGDNTQRIDIATRLVLRMLDEDDTVKDLAVKTIEELWFQTAALPPPALKAKTAVTTNNPHDNSLLLSKVAVIMGVSANFKDRQSPLEDVLHKIMADKQGHDSASLHDRYIEICETLIDGLVDASDLPGFTVINCIRTIFLFTSAYPAILSGSNASTLLPYLKNATSSEEQATSDYLLKIFRMSIPHMPKTAAKFGQELQLALQPMIIKPSAAGGVLALQETVACMCAVVQNLTHDFVRLVALVKSCNGRLQQAIKRPATQPMAANEIKALAILIFIVSLLGEHCDFDKLRFENPGLTPDLNVVSKGPIIEHIYTSLLQLYEKYDNSGLRGRILQCLGFLFRAQPTLMTLESSATIMDEIFASPEEEGRGRLLKIIQEFLVSEASKHIAQEKENLKDRSKFSNVNMDELVGNTDGFADSGVSSAVVQRYLRPILEAALSQNLQIQAAAIDVLSFTIKQGLAHPLQSFPVIVALETSPIMSLSNRASALHAILHSKHTSLLNTRYTASARASYDYQKKFSTPIRGFRMQPTPTALLQRWYSLVRDKRPSRQDFLKALTKVFQGDPSYKSSQDDVDFTRYMAENFAAFDYKTQEEVFTVISYLTAVLSTTGTQLLEIVSPSHLLTQLRGSSQLKPPNPSQEPAASRIDVPQINLEDIPKADNQDNIAVMRSSVIVGMVILLKAHLKMLYSLSEDKCNKYVIGKKSALGDKPTTKRHENPISWDRLPFAAVPLLTSSDAIAQKARFLAIWNEDGFTVEPDDDLPTQS